MSFYDLATDLEEAFRRDEATTMSSIAFLPAQMGTVRAALKGLGKKKGQWNLEILEDEEQTTVRFEKDLEIVVPRNHWQRFQEMFDGDLSDQTYLDLSAIALQDSREDAIDEFEGVLLEQRMDEIKARVQEQLNGPAIQKASDITCQWLSRFSSGGSVSEGVLVSLPLLEGSADSFVESLTEECQEDLGQLEILLKKLDDFSTLRECAYLAGVRIPSKFEGVDMVFEAHTQWDSTNTFSIYINDEEVVEAVEEASVGLRRIGNVLYPRGGQLDGRLGPDNLIDVIRETIQGAIETGDEDE